MSRAFTLAKPDWARVEGVEPNTEEDSAQGVAERDLERLLAGQIDRVWRLARRLGTPAAEAEDIVQEVCIVLIRRSRDIETHKVAAFAAATTVRVTANWRRGRKRRPETVLSPEELPQGPELHPRPREDPEQALEHRRRQRWLSEALAAMTESQRVAFTLFELEQFTAREIADMLGVPEATVESRVARARQRLQRWLQARHAAVNGRSQ
jgi:RNA polymerase sigma-70 factor (ECF subfamily)